MNGCSWATGNPDNKDLLLKPAKDLLRAIEVADFLEMADFVKEARWAIQRVDLDFTEAWIFLEEVANY